MGISFLDAPNEVVVLDVDDWENIARAETNAVAKVMFILYIRIIIKNSIGT